MLLKTGNTESAMYDCSEDLRPPPRAEHQLRDQGGVLYLHGEWTVCTLRAAQEALADFSFPPFARVNLDGICHLDTAGALLINSLLEKKHLVPESGDPRRLSLLQISKISLSGASEDPAETQTRRFPSCVRGTVSFLNKIGFHVLDELRLLAQVIAFFGELLVHALRLLRLPRNLPLTAVIYHLDRVGVHALPVVCLLNFLIGLVIAYLAASSLAAFGAQIYVVALLQVVVLREMAVLITAILVAGRSGSSFTAQIGFMLYNQEVDSMRVMGLDPMDRLVAPRVLALVISLPCLVLAGDLLGLLGGFTAVWISLDISPDAFLQALSNSIRARHILVGLAKAPFFALAIGCVSCFLGFQATRGADSIGALTTRAVVESIFLVIALDAFFALILRAARI